MKQNRYKGDVDSNMSVAEGGTDMKKIWKYGWKGGEVAMA